ncbi:MAG: trypsin-like peptidase domain-containing protein [SAR324 cluster bacterium]|nr:trypsin-like peptidase domain-containing protein [SAR324 cluster bacterium]
MKTCLGCAAEVAIIQVCMCHLARFIRLTAIGLVLAALPAQSFAVKNTAETDLSEQEIERAVVFIEVTMQRGDWYSPWQRARSRSATGSGFILGPGLIMTNAHIVSDARQIVVRRNGDSRPYFAQVAQVAHDSDLALLKVSDPEFSRGVHPLQLGELPSLRTRVRTYGFPAGGEKISRTEGVVSRIEFITYLHSGADAHLGIQTDSAINPGNSGGPVLQEGKVVGVAFQTNTSLNDVGFFIPTTVVKRFLRDIEDSRYDGYGEVGIVTSNLINPSYREFLGLSDSLTGVVVDRVVPDTSAVGYLQPKDVIVAIDGIPIRFDGTIQYYGHMIGFEQIAEEKQVNDIISFTVWRDRAFQKITFPLKKFSDGRRVRSNFDVLPGYVVYAGLVFMKLDREYLKTFGNYWRNAGKRLLYDHFYRPVEKPESWAKETVVLTRILPHRVNSTYRGRSNSIVSSINGFPIERLSDVPAALEKGKGKFHRFEMEQSGIVLIMEREAAERAHRQILATYGIPSDRRLP